MKLVIIYGPPAVGKLTVARALEKITGFKILHNHLIGDLVVSLFDRGSEAANKLNQQIRTLAYGAAAENKLNGMITTFVYHHDQNEREKECISQYREAVHKYGGEISLVRLSCDIQVLRQRVANPQRMITAKLSSVEKLEKELKNQNLTGELIINGIRNLNIDNTDIAPEQAARIIKSKFNL
jgi:hypothetical protein